MSLPFIWYPARVMFVPYFTLYHLSSDHWPSLQCFVFTLHKMPHRKYFSTSQASHFRKLCHSWCAADARELLLTWNVDDEGSRHRSLTRFPGFESAWEWVSTLISSIEWKSWRKKSNSCVATGSVREEFRYTSNLLNLSSGSQKEGCVTGCTLTVSREGTPKNSISLFRMISSKKA